MTDHHDDTARQLATLRAELAAERASRQDWAAEAMRLDVENEQLRAELQRQPTTGDDATDQTHTCGCSRADPMHHP